MKPLFFLAGLVSVCLSPVPVHAGSPEDCTWNGINLWGKVEIVEHFADIKVEIVDHFSDYDIKFVDHFPDKCGKWQPVEHFGDFTVKFVDNFGDIKISIVEHFPGIH
jgi:hypothetical protein